jgi:DNA-binding response OmpR family regulator
MNNKLTIQKDKLRILVVEDSPGDIFLIKFYLEELDPKLYEIESVSTLEEAHKKLTYDQFDVTLLDLHLPDSEGLVTLTSSVEKFPNQTFIVLTGLSDEKTGFDAVKKGAHDYLVKGRIDGKVLDSSIKFSVERNKIRQKIFQYYESVAIIEKMHNEVAFIVDMKDESFQHTNVFNQYLNTDKSIKQLNDFIDSLDEKQPFLDSFCSIQSGAINELKVSVKGQPFLLKFGKGQVNNIVVGTLKKL